MGVLQQKLNVQSSMEVMQSSFNFGLLLNMSVKN